MSKKVIFPTLTAFVLVVALVVVFFLHPFGDDGATVQQVPTATYSEDGYMEESTEGGLFDDESLSGDDDVYNTDVIDDINTDDSEYTPVKDNIKDNTNDITTTVFTIDQIIDHTNGEKIHPRVVFGAGYVQQDNFIKFDNDGNFEMHLSGFYNNTTTGKYEGNEETIYVEYTDGTAAEYPVVYNDDGIISYIIVNYGDYDLYFS